jgi:magnesium transporter
MAKLAGKHSRKAGLPPGALVHTGERKTQTPRIMLFDYDEQNFQEKQPTRIEECFPFKETATVTWINIDGLHDVGLIEKLGRQFELHPLILEDILSTEQRPKLEDYDKHLFIVVRMLTYNGQADSVEAEQVSMVVGANFLTPFQETVGDAFDVIRDRIRNAKGRIRKMGADYLAYSLIDAIVDNYFGILEKLGEKIGSVEEELATSLQESLRLYNTAYGYHRDLPAMTVAAVAMLSHFR